MKIGYASVFASDQDRVDQVAALVALGVAAEDVYTDRSHVGAPRNRSGRDAALARCGAGDTLVVTALERLAHSITDACAVSHHLQERSTCLAIGDTVYDPQDPEGAAIFTALSILGEFQAALVQVRAREGRELARSKGEMPGRGPKLSDAEMKRLAEMHRSQDYTMTELAAEFGASRSTIYRTLRRMGEV